MNCVESYAAFKLSHDSAAWKYMYCIFILCTTNLSGYLFHFHAA